jgi:hypothetical protein
VPLSDDACAVLETLPLFGGCDFLFTSNGAAPIHSLGSKTKAQLDEKMLAELKALARRRGDDLAQVKLAPWVNYDLRRTARSNLSALSIEDHIAEMVLGHGRRGLQRVYDQHRYEPQIREALSRWAARLREIVQPTSPAPATPSVAANVVALKRRAGR